MRKALNDLDHGGARINTDNVLGAGFNYYFSFKKRTPKTKKLENTTFLVAGFFLTVTKETSLKPFQSIFSGYLTHSVFCLWVIENHDKEISNCVISERVKMNAEKRGFVKFKELYI